MRDWRAYSRLMTSLELYQAFSWAEYVLVVQLDAIVFVDEIDVWADRAFDHVGPPWWTRGPNPLKRSPRPAVSGIGGVCLRRTKSCIRVLEHANERRCRVNAPRSRLYRSPKWKASSLLTSDRSWVSTRERAQSGAITEDEFWAMEVPRWFDWSMPSAVESLNFAFDMYPRLSVKLTTSAPFAVHGRRNVEALFAISTKSTDRIDVDEFGRGDTTVLAQFLRG